MELSQHLKTRMAQRKLAHAYLVVGENRRQLADQLAAAWVCTGRRPLRPPRPVAESRPRDPSRHCPGGSGGGEGLKAEAVRALRSDAYILPNEAPRKVYLLEHAELLNQTGQNILLKLIEEGPSYACFLFLSPNPELLLPTIRSRCETLRAPGRGNPSGQSGGGQLANLILTGAPPKERLPFLISWKSGTGKRSVGCWRRPWPGSPPPCPSGRTFCRCWTGLPPFSGPATSTSVRAICAAGLPPLCR